MPQDRPLAGEIWQTNGVEEESVPTRAVITEIAQPDGVPIAIIASTMGRVARIPVLSLRLAWSYQRGATLSSPCSHNGCDRAAYLRVLTAGHVRWVCDRHIPVGHRTALPGDPPPISAPPSSAAACPLCGTSSADREDGRGMECRNCRVRWIARPVDWTQPETSVAATDDAIAALQDMGLRPTRALVPIGSPAPLQRLLRVVPVEFVEVSGAAADRVVVLVDPPGQRRNVQRLGGQPNSGATIGPETPLPRLVIGSRWWDPDRNEFVVVQNVTPDEDGHNGVVEYRRENGRTQVISVNGMVGRFMHDEPLSRVVRSEGLIAYHVTNITDVAVTLRPLDMADGARSHAAQEITVSKDAYETGFQPWDTMLPKPGSVWTETSTGHVVDVVRGYQDALVPLSVECRDMSERVNRIPLPLFRVEHTPLDLTSVTTEESVWRSRSGEQLVTIQKVRKDADGEMFVHVLGQGHTSSAPMLATSLWKMFEHLSDKFVSPCAEGEEWWDDQDRSIYVIAVDTARALIRISRDPSVIGDPTSPRTDLVPASAFDRWRKADRSTVYARLMDDPLDI